jgi:hypothetical protein
MQRGSQALMGIISNEPTTSVKHVKGRYKEERDDAIACRFFYWGHIKERRYDVCCARISKEYFVSELVVGQILLNRQSFIKQLRLDGIKRADLQRRYPWLNWN